MKRASGVTRYETRLETSWVVPRSPTEDNRLNSSMKKDNVNNNISCTLVEGHLIVNVVIIS